MQSLLKLLLISMTLCPVIGLGKTVKTVEATGLGSSARSALSDASRNAVSQVLDTIVESKTVIIDEEVIEDKVIAVSGGFLENIRVLEPAKKSAEGVYTVKIRADVKYDKLSEEISHYSSSETDVQISNTKDKQAEMVDFLFKRMDDYMKLWKFTVGKCSMGNHESQIIVELDATLSVSDYASKFMKPLQKQFAALGIVPAKQRGSNATYVFLGKVAQNREVEYPIELLPPSYTIFKFRPAWEKNKYIIRVQLKNAADEILEEKDFALWSLYENLGLKIQGSNSIDFCPLAPYPRKIVKGKVVIGRKVTFTLYEHQIEDVARVAVKMLRVDAQSPTD